MHQLCDEIIGGFSAHLRGQASIYKFVIKCPGCDMDLNYTKNILCDILTHGLADLVGNTQSIYPPNATNGEAVDAILDALSQLQPAKKTTWPWDTSLSPLSLEQ